MRRLPTALLVLALPLAAACQQAPLDGGWSGRADCDNNDVLNVEALLDERFERDDVKGIVFIEWVVELGLLGRPRFTQRSQLQDGEFDPSRGRLTARVKADEGQGGGDAPDFSLRADLSDDLEELEGSLHRLDDNGDIAVRCDLELDRFDQPGN